jgi:hypothetical protein
VDGGDSLLDRCLVRQRGSGRNDLDVVVEGHDAEVVPRVEPVDESDERGSRAGQTPTAHGAAAVQDDLQGGGLAGLLRGRGRGVELHEERELVVLLHGDEVAVEAGGQVHERLQVADGIGGASHCGTGHAYTSGAGGCGVVTVLAVQSA